MKEAADWLKKHEVTQVECIAPDMNGAAKGKLVPAEQILDSEIRIAEAIFGQDTIGQWCHDDDLFQVADVDMVMIPDYASLSVQPWSEATASCICDCRTLMGKPLSIAPRTILRNLIGKFAELGVKPMVAQEAEFYLVAPNPDPLQPVLAAPGLSGRTPRSARSFQVEAMGEYAPFIKVMHKHAELHDIEITGTIQEMGEGQLEVNFMHGDALGKADEMFYFKRLVRQAAQASGFNATFMAMPMGGAPGSAMHLHQSLLDIESGNNVFVDQDGGFTDLFRAYLGGLQKYTPAVMPLLAPNVNSYRRFEGAVSCPTNVEWGLDNRTTGFRVPVGDAAATRIENRIPGSDNNPYLAIAASLVCGYLGLTEELRPRKAVDDSAWDLDHKLPRSLRESLDLFTACEPVVDLLGERFVKVFCDIRRREIEAFSSVVTAWEREHLLLTV